MNISIHLITSTILTLILYPFLGPYTIGILVGGYLIDFDHYLLTILKIKTFSIKKSYKFHYKRTEKKNYERDLLHIFHTTEFFIFMFLASIFFYITQQKFFFYIFTTIFLGMLFHITLDITDMFKKNIFDARAISIILWIKRRI